MSRSSINSSAFALIAIPTLAVSESGIALYLERLGDDVQDIVGERDGDFDGFAVRPQHAEFVSAQSRNHHVLGQTVAQSRRQRLQQRVAHRVAERVVDVLESVEVDVEDGEGRARQSRRFQRALAHLAETDAVAKPGQRVVIRKILRLRVGLLSPLDFQLQALIDLGELARAFLYAPLEILVHRAERRLRPSKFGVGALALDLSLDAGQSDREIHRLGHIIVRPGIESVDDIFARVVGGAHDHRERIHRPFLTDLPENFHAVHVGHVDVEKNDVEFMAFDVLERLSPAIRFGHPVAPPHEASAQDDAVVLDVVDDKQTHRFVVVRKRLRPMGRVEARRMKFAQRV